MIHTRTYRLARLLLAASLMLAGMAACAPPERGAQSADAGASTTTRPTASPASAVAATSTAEPEAETATVETAATSTAEPDSQVTPGSAPTSATTEANTADIARPAGWSDATHGDDAEPNYAVVFPQDRVNQITITITPENWARMQANMTELFGEPRGGPSDFPGPDQAPSPGGDSPGEGPALGGAFEGPGGGMDAANPTWVTSTISFDGQTWTNVGVRFKGNSSLVSSWHSGKDKLPFKLDFDQWEDEYPEITDQRFYGFKQLSLSNNMGDATYMREAVVYDLLRDAGLVASETAFYEVLLDHGDGPVSLGLYTAIEVVDDTVVERSFGDDSGNIYEADGRGASLAAGTVDEIATSFQKENNEESDWSDIEALYEVLHAAERTTDPGAWRAKLEEVFDVDGFLEWLAISAVVEHWDTYGAMTHNYYLYNNPHTGKLTWISWDHNLVLGAGGPGGPGGHAAVEVAPPDGSGTDGGANVPELRATPVAPPVEKDAEGGASTSPPHGTPGAPADRIVGNIGFTRTALDKSDVGDEWPLIRYLLDDPTYKATYMSYLQEMVDETFDADALATKYRQLAEVIAPYAAKERSAETFEAAVQALIDRTYERAKEVTDFLAAQ